MDVNRRLVQNTSLTAAACPAEGKGALDDRPVEGLLVKVLLPPPEVAGGCQSPSRPWFQLQGTVVTSFCRSVVDRPHGPWEDAPLRRLWQQALDQVATCGGRHRAEEHVLPFASVGLPELKLAKA